MCFSSTASFAASAVLGSAGILSLKQVRRPSEYFLALCPFLFAIQQFFEGLLWLSMKVNNDESIRLYSVFFLIFAQIIWPFWVPLQFWVVEENKTRKRILFILFIAGVITSILFGIRMFIFPFYTTVRNHHIYYDLEAVPFVDIICKVFYIMAIVASPFISSMKGSLLLAGSLLLSLAVSFLLFAENLISVWCFIAALISGVIIYVLKNQHSKLTS